MTTTRIRKWYCEACETEIVPVVDSTGRKWVALNPTRPCPLLNHKPEGMDIKDAMIPAELDRRALDELSEWLTYPSDDRQWRSAADFIEFAASVVRTTGRPTNPKEPTE